MKLAALYFSLCAAATILAEPPAAVPAPIQPRQAPRQLVRPIPAPFNRVAPQVNLSIRSSTRPPIGLPSRKQVEAVTLINGDVFAGKFIGIDPKKGLLWDHPFMQPKPLSIDPTKVSRITFAPKPLPEGAKRGTTRVSLSNGDELIGELNSLNKDSLILKTWYGGQLTLKRDSLRQLIPGQEAQDDIYSGPKAKEEWTHSNSYAANVLPPGVQVAPNRIAQLKARSAGRWVLQDGAFQSNGIGAQVGRDFELPDLSNIEFDLEWTSNPSVYLSLFTDNLKSYTKGNSYSARISSTSVYIYRYSQGRGSRIGDTARYTTQIQPGAPAGARYSFRIDKEKKIILLFVNNRFVHKWVDPGNFAGNGKGLMFRTGTANAIRLSNLRISPWDGNIPGKTENAATDEKTDSVRLANSDLLKGSLKSIKDGTLDFTYFEADMEINIGKISTIHFRQSKHATATPAEAVRLTLKDRGRLTCALKEWKDGKVRVSSPTLGEATIDTNIIEVIDFNPVTAKTTATTTNPPVMINPATGVPIPGGGRIQILPRKGGIRIEQKLQIFPRVPRPQKKQ